MRTIRMRTKLLFCFLAVSIGLTTLSLLIIGTSTHRHIRERLHSDLNNSLNTFQNLQAQRREMLRREAALLADLPSLKALMTAPDARTIQDGAAEFWRVSGGDFFALTKPDGSVQALYDSTEAQDDHASAVSELENVLRRAAQRGYLLDRHKLYEISIQPLYFGDSGTGTLLGYVAIGYEISERVAREVSEAAAADVVFFANGEVISTTLTGNHQAEVSALADRLSTTHSEDTFLGKEHYLIASVPLSVSGSQRVHLLVLKSYDRASLYLGRLNELIASLGVLVLLIGGGLAIYLSGTITQPLETLVSGAHALGAGDFDALLPRGGTTEIRELSDAFDVMRHHVKKTQQELLEAERLATIGEMASSISHDLRHHLTAVYANAEFLGYSTTNPTERVELLGEIQLAVNGMTELIESLLLFSRTGRALHPSLESVPQLVEHTMALVRSHPDAQGVSIAVETSEQIDAWIDARKIDRAIYNLLLNACQAAKRYAAAPKVNLSVSESVDRVYVRITDNGAGVAESIRTTLFEPFVSEGKQSGVGLGLTLSQKIAQEHGGDVSIDQARAGATSFTLSFAKNAAEGSPKEKEASHALPAS